MTYKITGDTVISNAFTGEGSSCFNGIVAETNFKFLSESGAQGSSTGYISGGSPPSGSYDSAIEKFPFASSTSTTDVGDLTVGREGLAGQSSFISGYSSGGGYCNTIDKFPFAIDSNATDVGDLVYTGYPGFVGQSSVTHGYTSGQRFPVRGDIDKFPFATDTNATSVGNLTVLSSSLAGQSSSTHGYTSNGFTRCVTIDKFPFATDTDATDVGDLTVGRWSASGQNSAEYGYTSGGADTACFPPTEFDVIDKFPFASDTNATDVGNLTTAKRNTSGQSSTVHGYVSGGERTPATPPVSRCIIQRFPFASDANASCVGSLTACRICTTGQQV